MKKILGLDIGTNSIGWAIVEASDDKSINAFSETSTESDINNPRKGIHRVGEEYAVGVRIIPQEEEHRRFLEGRPLNDPKGSALTRTANRRVKRGTRRMKSRYKLRRDKLLGLLYVLGMLPEGNFEKTIWKDGKICWVEKRSNSPWFTNVANEKADVNGVLRRTKRSEDEDGISDIGEKLYKLRDKAVRQPIGLKDWGRIVLHLNQWRGYSSDRFKKEEGDEKKGETNTSLVTSIEEGGDYDTKYRLFKVLFDNGDTGMEVRKKTENASTFIVGELATYAFDGDKEINGVRSIKPKKLDTESWAFRKKKINDSIRDFISETEGTLGSFLYQNFYINGNLNRIRNHVIDRYWYEDEFEKIWAKQYPLHKQSLEQHSIDELLNLSFKDEAVKREVKSKRSFEEQLKFLIKEKIIYFQRPWQQSKSKGHCRFEKIKVKRQYTNPKTGQKETKEEYEGRTVMPRSHPLHQEYKVWQQINNVRLWRTEGGVKTDLFVEPDLMQQYVGKSVSQIKQLLYEELQQRKSLSWKAFVKDKLGLPIREAKSEVYYEVNFIKKNKKGEWQDNPLKGNTTKIQLLNVLANCVNEPWFDEVNKETEEKRHATNTQRKANQKEGLENPSISNGQLLWEIIYDITNAKEDKVAAIIERHFGFDKPICTALSKITFDDKGMSSLSAKAVRKLLPLMRDGNEWNKDEVLSASNWKTSKEIRGRIDQLLSVNEANEMNNVPDTDRLFSLKDFISDKAARKRLSHFRQIEDFRGLNFWEAAAVVYGHHSKYGMHSSEVTKDKIAELIKPVKPGSMNNPVVERIVNETLALIKQLYERYNGFDEIRIELSRELKASMEEREQMWEAMNNGRNRNELAKAMLRELQKPLNGKNIDKVKLFEDVVGKLHEKAHEKAKEDYKVYEPSKRDIKKYLHWLDQQYQCPYTGEFISLSEALTNKYDVDHIIPKERYFDNSYSNKVLTRHEVNDFKKSRTAWEFIQQSGGEEVPNAGGLLVMSQDTYESHVLSLFPKGKKRTNLLRKEIPEDPVARQLKETQYINKRLREELAKIVGIDKVWTTTGAITDILRESWHCGDDESKLTLNGVMQQLMRTRFETVKYATGKKNKQEAVEQENTEETDEPTNTVNLIQKVDTVTGEVLPVEKFIGYSKRLDHRHHALDAIIIACTRQQHIQYINTLNAQYTANQSNDDSKKAKYEALRHELCTDNSKNRFKTPWHADGFIPQVRKALESIIVSHKNVKALISPSRHRITKNGKPIEVRGADGKPQQVASLRGELHKETIYARRNYFDGAKKPLKKIVEDILKAKMVNQQNQNMVRFRTYEEIIRQIVLKQKYQKALLPFLLPHEKTELNKSIIGNLSKDIIKAISQDSVLGKLECLSVFNEKSSAARPPGLAMDLNSPKELKDIADPRMKRLALYRLSYVQEQRKTLEAAELEKAEKDKRRNVINNIQLFTNAIYEVRIRSGDSHKMVFLPDLKPEQLKNIDYGKLPKQRERAERIKQLLQERINTSGSDYEKAFANIIEYPLFLDEKKKIPVKKLRQKAWFDKGLYEIKPKRFVQSNDSFMLYVFEHRETKERKTQFLKFIDAIAIINDQRPEHVTYNTLIPPPDGYKLLFTLQKNDLVFWNPQVPENEIDFNNQSALSKDLYIVKDINPSQEKIFIQPHTSADFIKVNEQDIKHLYPKLDVKAIEEKIKHGTKETALQCVKLIPNKNYNRLGKLFQPYWQEK